MGIGLNAAKAKLQLDIMNALEKAYKSTFIYGAGEEGNEIAQKFAQEAAGPMADAILNFISQAQIVGQNPLVSTIVAPPMTGGPCVGMLAFTGTELSLI